MKITIELPDSALAGTITYVWRDNQDRMTISCSAIDTGDLKDGNEITLPRYYPEVKSYD